MPVVPDFKRPQKTDIPSLDEPTVKALDPVSDQIDRLTRATQGKLSHYSNLNCDVRDIVMRSGVPAIVAVKKIRGKPTGMEVVYTTPGYYHSGFWEPIDDKTIRVTVAFSTNPQFTAIPTTTAVVRIRVWGD